MTDFERKEAGYRCRLYDIASGDSEEDADEVLSEVSEELGADMRDVLEKYYNECIDDWKDCDYDTSDWDL